LITFHSTEMLAIPKWAAEELLRAPASCTKLYLYGQLRGSAHDIDQISAETGLPSGEVLEGLETLKNLMLITDDENTAVYDYQLTAPLRTEQPQAVYDNTEFNVQLQALFSDRILSMKDYAAFYECKEVYGLPETVILMLAEHCIVNHKVKNRLPMSFLKKVGQEWAEEGINTVALASAKMEAERSRNEGAREILRIFNFSRRPTEEEEKLYQKWTNTWGFSFGGIRAAMAATTATGNPSMKYLDSILKDLYSKGKVTQNDVAQHLLATEQADDTIKKLLSRIGASRRSVTDEQRKLYSRWTTMGFSEKEILYAGSVAHASGYASFDHVDKLLTGWRMKNLVRLEDIEALLKKDEERRIAAEALLSRAGIEKSVTKTDIEKYERMQRKYGFSAEIMLYAAECAYGYSSPMKAIDTILSGWQEKGVTNLEQAREEHRAHKAKTTANRNTSRFDDRSYTREELDARIKDPLKELMEGLEE